MANQFMKSITLANGQVTGGQFVPIGEDDLPRPTPSPAGSYYGIVVDQWGRVVGGRTELLGTAHGGTGADLSAASAGFVLAQGPSLSFLVGTTVGFAVTFTPPATFTGGAVFQDTIAVTTIFDGTATSSAAFTATAITLAAGGTTAQVDASGLTATELHAGNGASGTFTSADAKTVTVVDGVITSIV